MFSPVVLIMQLEFFRNELISSEFLILRGDLLSQVYEGTELRLYIYAVGNTISDVLSLDY